MDQKNVSPAGISPIRNRNYLIECSATTDKDMNMQLEHLNMIQM